MIDATSIRHKDDVSWWEHPIPEAGHRCWVQTSGWTDDMHQIVRCPCGAVSFGEHLKRHAGASDKFWNSQWNERNSRLKLAEPGSRKPKHKWWRVMR